MDYGARWEALTGILAAVVITVATPSGELEIGVQGKQVSAALDKVPVPEERITRDGETVTIRGDGDTILARVDLSPDRNAYVTVGGPKRLRIGVNTKGPEAALAEQLGLDASGTVVVTDVTDDMPAAEAGLRQHDIIIAINGNAPSTQARLTEELDRMKPGESLTLSVLRRGKRHDITVKPRLVAEPAATRYGDITELLAVQNPAIRRGDYLSALNLLSRAQNQPLATDVYNLRRAATPVPAKADDTADERQDLAKQIERLKHQLQRVEDLLKEAEKK